MQKTIRLSPAYVWAIVATNCLVQPAVNVVWQLLQTTPDWRTCVAMSLAQIVAFLIMGMQITTARETTD